MAAQTTQTKLENGTDEDIIVNLVSDGFKIKLKDLGPEEVYTITTDKGASGKEYVIALALPRDSCGPMDITSEDLEAVSKVTIKIKRTANLHYSTEGGARGTDDSASPNHPTSTSRKTDLENSTKKNIIVTSVKDGSSATPSVVKPGDVYPITPDVTAKYAIALAVPGEFDHVIPVDISGAELAGISKVTIYMKSTEKLEAEVPTRGSGLFRRFLNIGNRDRARTPTREDSKSRREGPLPV